MVLIALTCFMSGTATAPAQTPPPTPPPKPVKTPTHLQNPTAEPEHPEAYSRPVNDQVAVKSEADIGPVLKHFVRASEIDPPGFAPVEDNATMALHEKIALDKQISFPLVHDVQNDGSYVTGNNDALDAERRYLNWGAITGTQLRARQGHYFTVTVKNTGPKGDYIAEFEYRQVKSKDIVRNLIQKLPAFSGTTRAYFAVVNMAYLAYGPVSAWRLTIRKNNTIVAQTKSFVW